MSNRKNTNATDAQPQIESQTDAQTDAQVSDVTATESDATESDDKPVSWEIFAGAVSLDELSDGSIATLVRQHLGGLVVERGAVQSEQRLVRRFRDRPEVGDFLAALGAMAGNEAWGVGLAKSCVVSPALASRNGLVSTGERETAVSAAWRELDSMLPTIQQLLATGNQAFVNMGRTQLSTLRQAVIKAHTDKRSAPLATDEQNARFIALKAEIAAEVESRSSLKRGQKVTTAKGPNGKTIFVPESEPSF